MLKLAFVSLSGCKVFIQISRLAPVVFVLYLFLSFSALFFLSWSSLIQLKITYGWTKPFFLAKGLK